MRKVYVLALIITSIALWLASCQLSTRAQSSIVVDQMGYRPNDKKIAFLKEHHSGRFTVLGIGAKATALRGEVHPLGRTDQNTGDLTFTIDFSELKEPGMYRIYVGDSLGFSEEFGIGEDDYNPAVVSSLESFSYQRCGTAVGDGTPWKHPACHMKPAHFFDTPAMTMDVSGGWHDAGDYNKFVPTTAVSVAFLLYIYELRPDQFVDGQLRIPEARNCVPDILDEARWGLTWLLKMQASDGGVYHKVSIRKWTGEHLPEKETDTQFIFGVSSTATGDFAAVTALGARLFGRWDKEFAQSLLRASVKAWEFLQHHPSIVPEGGFKNPDGVEGGEYGDESDSDERLWASVELFKTTGNLDYHEYFLSHYRGLGGINYAVSWQHVQDFAYISYLSVPVNARNYQARSFVIATLTDYCDVLMKRIMNDGYRYALLPDQQYWGSNSVAMGNAFNLINAYELTKFESYRDGALDQLHYMLGRNTFGMVFLTGLGADGVRHPYHQPSMLAGSGYPVPGLLVSGCNKFSRLKGREISGFAGLCYEDNEKNYFVNEPAINYTASFVYVAAYCSSPLNTAIAKGKQ